VRRTWQRKLILKGIMHVDDARTAIDLGADAIIVSNHGGRQLDGAPSSISVLPQIAEAVNGRIEVFFDGGIRTGADIVKAMGCGADACLTGRGYLYGLAARGYDGVKRAGAIARRVARLHGPVRLERHRRDSARSGRALPYIGATTARATRGRR